MFIYSFIDIHTWGGLRWDSYSGGPCAELWGSKNKAKPVSPRSTFSQEEVHRHSLETWYGQCCMKEHQGSGPSRKPSLGGGGM